MSEKRTKARNGAMSDARRSRRIKTATVVIMAIVILVPTAYGFGARFWEFIKTFTSVDGGGFTIVPIMNYTLISLGFVFLLVWAVANGMFRDVEGPKYTMLKTEEQLDRHEKSPGVSK